MVSKIARIKELVDLCNKYCDAYYNGEPIVSDAEYDTLYQELDKLEKETGFRLSISPTINVGYKVSDKLPKFKHDIPMLSLDKITTVQEIIDFVGTHDAIMSLKEDGLSIRLIYDKSGDLQVAATRGTGTEGSNITQNLCCFTNVPMHIETNGEEFIIDGEAICTFDNLERLNSTLDTPYKHPRAVASGTVSLLDQKEAKGRKLQFIAWKFTKGSHSNSYSDRLSELEKLGFDVVPWCMADTKFIESQIKMLQSTAKLLSQPYDGIVVGYDDIKYGESLGVTSKFPRHSKAYKFDQDAEETVIRSFEFSMGKTGQLTPVACFDEVTLDGTSVSRCSCHNISYCKNLKLGIGATVKVIKAMQIIPQIIECVEEGSLFNYPNTCPICGAPTSIQKDNESEVLICTNPNCSGKQLSRFVHFVSKKAMDIDGLSEATLELLISSNYISKFVDIYHLSEHANELAKLPGLGEKSVQKLIHSIEKSREVKLENFLVALCIPNIGASAAKTISKKFNGDYNRFIQAYRDCFEWTSLDDFGVVMGVNLERYLDENFDMIQELSEEMNFVSSQKSHTVCDSPFAGKTICITGSLDIYKNRDELVKDIEAHGGKAVGSVSKKTDYLLTNHADSGSTKARKALELNIPIISETDFRRMIGTE